MDVTLTQGPGIYCNCTGKVTLLALNKSHEPGKWNLLTDNLIQIHMD